MALLIRNGTLVTPRGRQAGDLRCRDGKIAEVGAGLEPAPGEEVLEAAGKYVFPGGVDPHVHMALPVAGTVSSDDFESGTRAALAGGTTTILDFVHPERGESLLEALAARRREAATAVVDYGLHVAVTGWAGDTAAQMARCVEEGIPSFKVYLAYKESVGLEDRELVRVLEAAAGLDALVLVHAEHGDMVELLRERLAATAPAAPGSHARSRPPELEGEATARAAALAGVAGARLYVVHVTCRQAVEAVAAARRAGRPAWGETCPHYLLLDESLYQQPGFAGGAYVCAPPLRAAEHQAVLWEALRDETLDVVATDHCPFTLEQKQLGAGDFRRIPGGLAGVEHRLALLYTFGVGRGRLTLERFVDLVSTRPARIFGLYPRKGSLATGADADLVVWDPEATSTLSAGTHHQRCDHIPYEGFEVEGLPAAVVAAGEVRCRDGELRVESGAGRFLRRGP